MKGVVATREAIERICRVHCLPLPDAAADPAERKAIYLRTMRLAHPDAGGSDRAAQEVNLWWEVQRGLSSGKLVRVDLDRLRRTAVRAPAVTRVVVHLGATYDFGWTGSTATTGAVGCAWYTTNGCKIY